MIQQQVKQQIEKAADLHSTVTPRDGAEPFINEDTRKGYIAGANDFINAPLFMPNPEALDLGEMFGIEPARLDEISKHLDEMVKSVQGMIYASSVFRYIENICHTREEFTWAMVNHMIWMAKRNRMPYNPEMQQQYIIKYGEPKHISQ